MFYLQKKRMIGMAEIGRYLMTHWQLDTKVTVYFIMVPSTRDEFWAK